MASKIVKKPFEYRKDGVNTLVRVGQEISSEELGEKMFKDLDALGMFKDPEPEVYVPTAEEKKEAQKAQAEEAAKSDAPRAAVKTAPETPAAPVDKGPKTPAKDAGKEGDKK